MEIKRNIRIKISETELKEIVIKHFENKGYNVLPGNVIFHISTHIEGYGTTEHEVTSFNGCTINVTV